MEVLPGGFDYGDLDAPHTRKILRNRYCANLGVCNVSQDLLKQVNQVVTDNLGAGGRVRNVHERNAVNHPVDEFAEGHLDSDEERSEQDRDEVELVPVPLNKNGTEFYIGRDNIVSVEVIQKERKNSFKSPVKQNYQIRHAEKFILHKMRISLNYSKQASATMAAHALPDLKPIENEEVLARLEKIGVKRNFREAFFDNI